jgi:hypothetical protein
MVGYSVLPAALLVPLPVPPVRDGWRPADMGLYMVLAAPLLFMLLPMLLLMLLDWWNRARAPKLCSRRSLTVASHSRPLLGGCWLRRTSVGQRVQVSAARGSGMPQMFCTAVQHDINHDAAFVLGWDGLLLKFLSGQHSGVAAASLHARAVCTCMVAVQLDQQVMLPALPTSTTDDLPALC